MQKKMEEMFDDDDEPSQHLKASAASAASPTAHM